MVFNKLSYYSFLKFLLPWSPSPDWNGNPFCFFFKNKKIAAKSRN